LVHYRLRESISISYHANFKSNYQGIGAAIPCNDLRKITWDMHTDGVGSNGAPNRAGPFAIVISVPF
jgi:hypothetical protein